MIDVLSELGRALPSVATGGAGVWIGQVLLQKFKSRDDRRMKKADVDVQIEQHRDKLVLDLIEAARHEASTARGDAASAREEVERLRPLQIQLAQVEERLAHFEEALEHLRAILTATSPEERITAERLAKAFLIRMRRLSEARGTARSEAQIAASKASLPIDMLGHLDKLDGA